MNRDPDSPLLAAPSEAERELVRALEVLERERQLPDLAEIERGAFVHLVHKAWTESQRRDGRRGHLSDSDVASRISEKARRQFTRNQFQTSFGEGKKSPDGGTRYKTGIPRDVAWAYMRIAFDHWSLGAFPGTFKPLLVNGHEVSDRAIDNACAAMFPPKEGPITGERLIYCRESPGFGVRSFYRECGRRARSLIATTTRDAFLMEDIGVDLEEWEQMLRALFEPDVSVQDPPRAPESIHVWAIKEPWVVHHPPAIRALNGITRLQGLLKIERALHESQVAGGTAHAGDPSSVRLWEQIDRRCIVAIKLHPSNDLLRHGKRGSEAPLQGPSLLIAEDFIFPSAVPLEWSRRGIAAQADELITVVTIDPDATSVSYNGFAPTAHHQDTRSIIQVPPPSSACTKSFLALYQASRAVIDGQRTDSTLAQAYAEGWTFLRPNEFIDAPLPLPHI